MKRYLYLLFMTGLLSACFGGGAVVPEDRFYRLAELPAQSPAVVPQIGVLAVAGLQSDDLLRERAILYSEAQAPLTLRRYHYHFWTHIPGQLIQEQLIDYLRAAGVARQVIRFGEQPQRDALIEGYIKRFERRVGDGRPRALVNLELIYKRGRDSQPVLREYAFEETAVDDSMHATVSAFSAALQKIYAAFVAEISAAQSPR